MTIDLAVIPVAGRGTRLLPLTKSQPKEMLPIARKPVVQYVVEELARSGIKRALFITGSGKTAIENHFDVDEVLISLLRNTGKEELLEELSFERLETEYFYTRQHVQLGLGHAVLVAKPLVGNQPFVVALGDSILGLHADSDVVGRMIELFEFRNADAVIAFEKVKREDVVRYGIADPCDRTSDILTLRGIVEKPEVENAPSNLAIAARYVFSPKIFDHLKETKPGKGGEIQLTDAVSSMCREGGRVLGLCLNHADRRFDIGNFESYYKAFVEFALSDPDYGVELKNFTRTLVEK